MKSLRRDVVPTEAFLNLQQRVSVINWDMCPGLYDASAFAFTRSIVFRIPIQTLRSVKTSTILPIALNGASCPNYNAPFDTFSSAAVVANFATTEESIPSFWSSFKIQYSYKTRCGMRTPKTAMSHPQHDENVEDCPQRQLWIMWKSVFVPIRREVLLKNSRKMKNRLSKKVRCKAPFGALST